MKTYLRGNMWRAVRLANKTNISVRQAHNYILGKPMEYECALKISRIKGVPMESININKNCSNYKLEEFAKTHNEKHPIRCDTDMDYLKLKALNYLLEHPNYIGRMRLSK